MTTAEKLQEEGRLRGLEEGRLEGERRLLLRLLRRRFGELSEVALERVSRAQEAELELWADRVLSTSSLDEVFGS